MEKMYTLSAIAELIQGLTEKQIKKEIKDGRLKAKRVGLRTYIITESFLQEWLNTPTEFKPVKRKAKAEGAKSPGRPKKVEPDTFDVNKE